jgi:hypothetical protein
LLVVALAAPGVEVRGSTTVVVVVLAVILNQASFWS